MSSFNGLTKNSESAEQIVVYYIEGENKMNPKLYNILTENQRKKYRKNRKAARKILNVPYGYVMHHKDETLLHTDLDRYVE